MAPEVTRNRVAGGLAILAASLPSLAAASCSDLKDCGSCVKHTMMFSHDCEWCDVDGACHAVGSLETPCRGSDMDDWCVSDSSLSSCTWNHTACPAAPSLNKEPQQIHLAFAGPDGMRVTFKSWAKPTIASVVVTPSTSSALSRKKPTRFVAEKSVQYLDESGYHSTVKLTGLAAGQTYNYHVNIDGAISTSRSFSTPADDLMKANVLVVADMGYGANGHAVQSRARMEHFRGFADFILHAGDVGYADDSFVHFGHCNVEFCYEQVYDHYMSWMENLTDSLPYMVGVGNHESECHSPACLFKSDLKKALANFSAYNTRFAMPSSESGGALNMWYSFDYGPVHFVMVNTETDFKSAPEADYGDGGKIAGSPAGHFASEGEYLRWLEADLNAANANRDRRPWVVAVGHRPWILAPERPTEAAVKAAHAPLFEKYGVDLYLSGHQHNYQRFLPLGNNTGTPIIITGGAGCDEFAGDQAKSGKVDKKGKTENWDWRYYTVDTQIGTLQATATELTWQAVRSSNGEVFDEVNFHKPSSFSSIKVV